MEKHFDIIVIGAGSGGLNIASFMNRIGLRVLLIDKSDESIGGDCLNYGCVPSKALIHVSRLVADGKHVARFGISQQGKVDLKEVMRYVKEKQDVIREHENAAYFRKKGIEVVLGAAAFSGERTVKVGDEEYTAKRIIVATGSRPRELKVPGIETVPVYTNETIFNAAKLPRNLVVIGGGPIGFEIGQAFRRLGAEVTITNKNDMWLAKESRETVAVLMKRMNEEGVRFLPTAEVKRIENDHAVFDASGKEIEIPCDALFVSIGRELNIDTLNAAAAGIRLSEQGKPVVDQYLRTTNKRVFVVGDVVGQHQFTHAAEVHAALVLRNFFLPRMLWKKLNTDGMAWVTYTDPEIATFGLEEAEFKKRGVKYAVIEKTFADNDRSITDSATDGLARLYVGKKGKVLGGTMVGKDAGELIQELILAQTTGLTLKQLFSKVYPYPTAARINKLLAAEYLGAGLTERAKRILRFLY